MQHTDLDAVRAAAPLSTAFESVTDLVPRGPGEWMACCPFHADDTPSLSISDSRARFHCFGCGASGDIFEFERRTQGLDTLPEAIASLAARLPAVAALVGLRKAPTGGELMRAAPPRVPVEWGRRVKDRKRVAAVLQAAVERFRVSLEAPAGADARAYLDARGVGELSRDAFGFGLAGPPDEWTFTVDALAQDGFSNDDCIAAGLASVSKNETVYDLFRGRIVFPICDPDGSVVGMAGRLMRESDRSPKYINSRESALFRKKEVLFGSHLARAALNVERPEPGFFEEAAEVALVVVEGYMDAVALFERSGGKVPVVASMGTAVSPEQVTLALGLLPDPVDGRVLFNFDGDEAGRIAAERLCDSVLVEMPEAFRVAIAFPPEGVKDADEYLSGELGSADDYLVHLNATAMAWPKWRGERILRKEMERVGGGKGDDGLDLSTTESIERALAASAEATGRAADAQGAGEGSEDKLVVSGLPVGMEADSEAMFSFQLNEELSRESDRMLLAFGAPKEELKKTYPYRKKTITLDCSPSIIEELATFLAKAERCLVGLNSADLIQSWADALSGSETAAIPAVFALIADRTTELNRDGEQYSPETHVRWMTPAPYIIDELPKREREKLLRSLGREQESGSMSTENYYASTQTRNTLMDRFDFQSETVEPLVRSARCDSSRRTAEEPRRAAEERLLRGLVFCGEAERLDGLERVLAVMVRVEEGGLRFWTAGDRQGLFAALSEIEGEVTPDEIAAACEREEWWGESVEDIFLPDGSGDDEWDEIRRIDLANPVDAVEAAAGAIEAMEKQIRGRLAVDKMDASILGAIGARERGDFEEMDRNIAEQIVLRGQVQDSSRKGSEKALEEQRREAERVGEEVERKRKGDEILGRVMRGEDVPAPEGFRFIEEDGKEGIKYR